MHGIDAFASKAQICTRYAVNIHLYQNILLYDVCSEIANNSINSCKRIQSFHGFNRKCIVISQSYS